MSYFKPWRRKLGLVALLVACVLMSGWMRSNQERDRLGFGSPLDTDFPCVVSHKGRIAFRFFEDVEPDFQLFYDRADDRLWHPLITVEPFTVGSGRCLGGGHSIVFSYRSIVLPFTLLSAYLLLSKPRA